MMVQRYAPPPTRAVDYRPMRPLYLRTSGRPGTLRTEWKIAMRGSEHTTTIRRNQRVAITSMARGSNVVQLRGATSLRSGSRRKRATIFAARFDDDSLCTGAGSGIAAACENV
jgi:hypothetical protein